MAKIKRTQRISRPAKKPAKPAQKPARLAECPAPAAATKVLTIADLRAFAPVEA